MGTGFTLADVDRFLYDLYSPEQQAAACQRFLDEQERADLKRRVTRLEQVMLHVEDDGK